MRWPFLSHPPIRAFAHRGGNEVAPENTLAAFEHAVSLGYRYLETDVHATTDGVLVAFHDAGLERIAGNDAAIDQMTWEELSRIKIVSQVDGSVHRIPRLADLLEALPEAFFNIDPKSDRSVHPLIRLIKDFDLLDRAAFGSFSDERIDELRGEFGPRLCASLGPTGLIKTLVPGLRSPKGYAIAAIPRRLGAFPVGERIVTRFQEAGLAVHVWTVNEPNDMRRFIDLGVDGIMTDRAETLINLL